MSAEAPIPALGERVERHRVAVVLALVALTALVIPWFVWRTDVARAYAASSGVSLIWAYQSVLDLGLRLRSPPGVLLLALVLAGWVAGSLVLAHPRRIARLLVPTIAVSSLFVIGVGLMTRPFLPRSLEGEGEWTCGNAIVDRAWGPGLALLCALACLGAAGLVRWTAVAWQELGRPCGSTAEEVSRVLFASAPGLLAVHALLGDALAGATPVAFGLPAGAADVGAFTATGCVLLGVGVIRILRRGRLPAADRAVG